MFLDIRIGAQAISKVVSPSLISLRGLNAKIPVLNLRTLDFCSKSNLKDNGMVQENEKKDKGNKVTNPIRSNWL